MKGKWELAGYIGVDAGLCWIGDPCYLIQDDIHERVSFPIEKRELDIKTWGEFCNRLHKGEKNGVMSWNYTAGHEGLGVSIGHFGGDGTYPVYVKRAPDGLILEAKVVFNGSQS